jgi:hypothetical protein
MTLTRRNAITAATAITGLTLVAGIADAQERHPRIRAAIRALQEAKEEMQHADHDFGGHRVDAIRECDAAIHQLEEALRYDRR